MSLQYGKVEGPLKQKVDDLFGDVNGGFVEVSPGNVLMPPKYVKFAQRILDLEVRPDDVWIVSYPRTGSTWTQEMVWCIGNDLNFQKATRLQVLRAPVLELTAMLGKDPTGVTSLIGETVDLVERMRSPRFIKSYLPKELLPRQLETVKPKIIYVCRNPKDIVAPYYEYCRLMHDLNGPFDDFCELFINSKVPMGPIWSHILGFWQMRNEPNVLFLRHEELYKDNEMAVEKTAKFLEKELTLEGKEALLDHLSEEKMRCNPAVTIRPMLELRKNLQPRSRSGSSGSSSSGSEAGYPLKAGAWESHLSEDMAKRFDEWAKKNLEGTGLAFD